MTGEELLTGLSLLQGTERGKELLHRTIYIEGENNAICDIDHVCSTKNYIDKERVELCLTYLTTEYCEVKH